MKKRKSSRVVEDYNDGDDEPYVPSNSEDEFSESDRILLETATKGRNAALEESEEEVFGLGDVDSDVDDEGRISDSDIEGKEEEEDDLPDVRAWGQKRKNFYSTDYVDQDYGGYDEKDVEAAEQEEEEARAIQKRLVEQLDDADFSLDLFTKKDVEKEEEPEEMIKTDLGKMSKRQKLSLMQKESPEFFGLVDDFKKSMVELKDRLEPMMRLIDSGKIPASPADDYVRTKYHLLLNYCTNITFYLLLKAKRIAVQSHPVVRRLYQFRQLIKQLESVDEVVVPQIEVILEEQRRAQGDTTDRKVKKKKKKMLKLLLQLQQENPDEEDHTDDKKSLVIAEAHDEDEKKHDIEENEEAEEEQEDEEGKRAITYQIAKNKGLTPRRKKENRNPRVKHRNKFRKAKIRRKGQVREPRKELNKYEGEISGIKIGVIKSVKLK